MTSQTGSIPQLSTIVSAIHTVRVKTEIWLPAHDASARAGDAASKSAERTRPRAARQPPRARLVFVPPTLPCNRPSSALGRLLKFPETAEAVTVRPRTPSGIDPGGFIPQSLPW